MAEENKNLKNELEYYKTLKKIINFNIYSGCRIFCFIGLVFSFFKFRKFFWNTYMRKIEYSDELADQIDLFAKTEQDLPICYRSLKVQVGEKRNLDLFY